MRFFKIAPIVFSILASSSLMANEVPHQGENKKATAEQIARIKAEMDKLGLKPISNDVVRISQDGNPVTHLQDLSIRLGKELASSILAEEAAARARGEKVPERKKVDLWAEREKEIAERQAKYGFEPTKKFVVPGTSPEVSARMFAENARVSKDADGNVVYETTDEIVTVGKDGVGTVVPRKVITITLTNISPDTGIDTGAAAEKTKDSKVQNAHRGSLDGVEEGFSASDMSEAEAILLRGGQGIRVEGHFDDVDDAKTIPVSRSSWERAFSTLLGIKDAYAMPADMGIEEIAKAGGEIIEKALRSNEPLIEENEHREWGQAEAIRFVNELAESGRLKPKFEMLGEEFVKSSAEEEQLRLVAQEEAKNPTGRDTYIFVSYSLGDKALNDILKAASGKDNVELVMRGVPEDSNLINGITRIRDLASKFDPIPNIIIDPALFRAYGVQAVPTVVRVSDKRMVRPKTVLLEELRDEIGMSAQDRLEAEKRAQIDRSEVSASYQGRTVPMMIAKVEGLNNARWLNEQIELGHLGDFGNRGYIYPIHEPDLVEVLQKRALGIDWESKKEAALNNFWKSQSRRFFPLKSAGHSCSRVLDPTFEVGQNLTDMEGRVLFAKGTQVNPLDARPFNIRVVVFNPTRKSDIEIVKGIKEQYAKEKPSEEILWIASEFDVERGWDAYSELTEMLGAPLFLLTPEIIDRWALTVTPSIITANNEQKHFIIEEIAYGDNEKRECNVMD